MTRPLPPGPWLFEASPRTGAGHEADPGLPQAVLFDRDGTLVADVPYNGDPGRVAPMPTAREAVAAVRALGIPVGVVSNQSGVARGLLTRRQVLAVRERVDGLFGPFAVWAVCPHGPRDACACRKPAPGLVLAACRYLGVPPERTVVIGDIGADVEAARAAGARGVLVPTGRTLPQEVAAAGETAPDLLAAVRLVLGDRTPAVAAPGPGSAP
ncbi:MULTISPECIES: D-glycero-alpha-D-manno-heptose-1,7-bisphosphate 7-phosphatase [unclassified Streptomyces]|uniref:D-glycero-alpha-D-manno-heptose-1,7-bisphosphate 7-phosphatase n=1 Tax=unclassified Streptomyces TaxID=2593676 RepID=UPI002E351B16|nr:MULTISPECIES: HAD-IIIA family hydrolase [unclassified Streptomyces]WUC63270.1 HAD-IIIA family hydrolase [Streptomyces sp. NBC_00539]